MYNGIFPGAYTPTLSQIVITLMCVGTHAEYTHACARPSALPLIQLLNDAPGGGAQGQGGGGGAQGQGGGGEEET